MTVFPLVISWFLTLGYVPSMRDSSNGITAHTDDGQTATVAQIGIAVSTEDDLFSIYTDVENYQYAFANGDAFSFAPFRTDYSFGLQIKPNDNIRFNIDHECDHPVSSSKRGDLAYDYISSKTTVSVTVSGKTRLFE